MSHMEKSTHQLGRELMSLPDVPVGIEGWTENDPVAVMSGYDPLGHAIIVSEKYHSVKDN